MGNLCTCSRGCCMQTDQSSSEEDQVVKAADNSRCTPPSSYAFELLVKDDKYLYTDASWSQQSPLSMSRPATPDCLRQRLELCSMPGVAAGVCTAPVAPCPQHAAAQSSVAAEQTLHEAFKYSSHTVASLGCLWDPQLAPAAVDLRADSWDRTSYTDPNPQHLGNGTLDLTLLNAAAAAAGMGPMCTEAMQALTSRRTSRSSNNGTHRLSQSSCSAHGGALPQGPASPMHRTTAAPAAVVRRRALPQRKSSLGQLAMQALRGDACAPQGPEHKVAAATASKPGYAGHMASPAAATLLTVCQNDWGGSRQTIQRFISLPAGYEMCEEQLQGATDPAETTTAKPRTPARRTSSATTSLLEPVQELAGPAPCTVPCAADCADLSTSEAQLLTQATLAPLSLSGHGSARHRRSLDTPYSSAKPGVVTASGSNLFQVALQRNLRQGGSNPCGPASSQGRRNSHSTQPQVQPAARSLSLSLNLNAVPNMQAQRGSSFTDMGDTGGRGQVSSTARYGLWSTEVTPRGPSCSSVTSTASAPQSGLPPRPRTYGQRPPAHPAAGYHQAPHHHMSHHSPTQQQHQLMMPMGSQRHIARQHDSHPSCGAGGMQVPTLMLQRTLQTSDSGHNRHPRLTAMLEFMYAQRTGAPGGGSSRHGGQSPVAMPTAGGSMTQGHKGSASRRSSRHSANSGASFRALVRSMHEERSGGRQDQMMDHSWS